jgi:hypothetical protein
MNGAHRLFGFHGKIIWVICKICGFSFMVMLSPLQKVKIRNMERGGIISARLDVPESYLFMEDLSTGIQLFQNAPTQRDGFFA